MKRLPGSVFLICLFLCACKNKEKRVQEDSNVTRKEYEVEKNPVEVMVLRRQDFNKQLVSNGRLEARRKSVLAFKASGEIASVSVVNGQSVSAGATLAALNADDAEYTLKQARMNMAKAENDFYDRLVGYGYRIDDDTTSIPRRTLDNAYRESGLTAARYALENAEAMCKNCVLRAPFAGKVADIKSKAYERSQGDFCTLIDDHILNVSFGILESELGFVKVGQAIRVSPFAASEKSFVGTVTEINPVVDKNGQIAVRAQVTNDGTLIDGMNVRILVENTVPGQLVVPKSAVVIRDNLEVLFRYTNGKALWTYVNIELDNSDSYVVGPNVSRGADLNVGDTVIISGNLNIGNDANVEIVTP